MYQQQVDKLTSENSKREFDNQGIRDQLASMGFDIENNKPLPTKDRYSHITGLTPGDINQLAKLDKEIVRSFEIQMRLNNKNSEMIRNKINDLNEKPALRSYLFKLVSDQELAKDIDTIDKEIADLYEF